MTTLTQAPLTISPGEKKATRLLTRAQERHFGGRLEKDLADELELMIQLRDQMASFLETRRDIPTDDEHDPEGPTLAFERAQSHAILQQTRQRSIETAEAIERLKSGAFGACQRCGTAIPIGRLEARPSAALCISCAS